MSLIIYSLKKHRSTPFVLIIVYKFTSWPPIAFLCMLVVACGLMPCSKDLSPRCPGTLVSWLRLFLRWCQENVCAQRSLSARSASELLVMLRLFFWTRECRNITEGFDFFFFPFFFFVEMTARCEMGTLHHSHVFKAKPFSFICGDVSCMVFHFL